MFVNKIVSQTLTTFSLSNSLLFGVEASAPGIVTNVLFEKLLKTLDTIGNCQTPVFSLGVYCIK